MTIELPYFLAGIAVIFVTYQLAQRFRLHRRRAKLRIVHSSKWRKP